MKEIILAKDEIAQCDDEDYEILNRYSWSKNANGYPTARINGPHMIMSLLVYKSNNIIIPEGMLVDHKDGDKLKNIKSNLRIVTHQQNSMNRKNHANCRSEYKGVNFCRGKNKDPEKGKWMSRIQDPVTRKRLWLGNFETEIEAAKAYDKAANELFGEYARYNFPDDYKSPDFLKV